MGQHDIEPDALGIDVGSTAIGRFHDAGAAAGHDDELATFRTILLPFDRSDLSEAPRLFIDTLLVEHTARLLRELGRVGGIRRGHARTAEDHDRRVDVVFRQQHFRLFQLQLEAYGPELAPDHEIHIGKGQTVSRRHGLRRFHHTVGARHVLPGMGKTDILLAAFSSHAKVSN